MRVAGLFAGIGGVERGFELAGLRSELLCEIDSSAQTILRKHFPEVDLHDDIKTLKALPNVEVVAAGFPCQDLSQAGRTAGIRGRHSGLVGHVFRLLDQARRSKALRWLVLENVPFMLHLDGGRAMAVLVRELESRGFTWAYRIIDTRAFGLPQRRQRVILVASCTEDPRSVLFGSSYPEPDWQDDPSLAFGFYWTEGLRGLGAAIDAVPTLKGGSTIGIPSPPAIMLPFGEAIVTPEIRDAERLQGFPADWTANAGRGARKNNPRWKLVGNAVSVPVAKWVGEQLMAPRAYFGDFDMPISRVRMKWPHAAWGRKGETYFVNVTAWPERTLYMHLHEFLEFPTAPLSARATAGFFQRLNAGSLSCFPPNFKDFVAAHLKRMNSAQCSATRSSPEASLSQL